MLQRELRALLEMEGQLKNPSDLFSCIIFVLFLCCFLFFSLRNVLMFFLFPSDSQKTDEQREREAELIEQLVSVVNKRDQLVQFEDSQLQQ